MNNVINSRIETQSYEPAQGRMQITQYNWAHEVTPALG